MELIRAVNEEDRTVELSFSSEEPYKRWFGVEILQHDSECVDLTRINEIGVLLFNHNSNSVLGKIISASIDAENRKGIATVQFDDDPQSELIYQKVLSGTLKGVSVGYMVDNWEEVTAGKKSTSGRVDGPAWVALRWSPYEISIVSVPADPTVGVGRSAEEEVVPAIDGRSTNINNKQEDEQMDKSQEKTNVIPAVDETAIRAQATADAVEIVELCRWAEMDATVFLQKGASVADVKDAIIAKKRNEAPAVPQLTVQRDEVDKFRAAATDAMVMRAGLQVDKPAEGAKELRGARLLDLGMDCYERQYGKRLKSYDKDEMVRAALSTSDFPLILANTGNKALMTAYNLAPTTYQIWTKRGSLSDFKAAKRLQVSELSLLRSVKEGGEYKYQTLTEAGETIQLGKFGDIVSLTREMIINDDLQAFSNILAKFGAVARMNVESAVYALLTANANLSDGVALFEATTHKNYTSSGTALSVASLGVGRAAMRKQKGLKGQLALNISPAFLIVPEDKAITAEQLIASTVDPAKTNNTPNPFNNRLTTVSCPILDDTSTASWYLAAAPGYVDTVEVAFLDGNDAPYMETRTGFEVDGIDYKVRYEFGAAVLDYRGLYKNVGA